MNVCSRVEEFTSELQSHAKVLPGNVRMLLCGCLITISSGDRPDAVVLKEIISVIEKNVGNGSRALKLICDLADRHGVTIMATVEPFGGTTGEGGLSRDELHGWYSRAGFVRVQADDIEREPRT
jgi:hypothetical protein